MGLALDSFEDIFSFLRKHPKVILLAFTFSILSTLFSSMLAQSIKTLDLVSISILVALGIILFFVSLIVAGVYQITVYQAVKKGEVEIMKAVQNSFGIFFKILLTSLLTFLIFGVPVFFVFLLALLLLKSSLIIFIVILVIVLCILFILFYVSLRLFLTFPILVIENKDPIESIKSSWKITEDNSISILAFLLLLGLIIGVISFPFSILKVVFEILKIDQISLIFEVIISTISGALLGPAAAIYYFNLKKSKI
jgi:membrane-anchored glycerophosphoryl diester phosphodiesterase (GDPDase)